MGVGSAGPARAGQARRSRPAIALLARWGPVVAWAGLIFAASSAPWLPLPPGSQASGDLWDTAVKKLGHVVEYGVLGALLVRALSPARLRAGLWQAALIGCLYGVSDELHQSIVPGRHPSVIDVAIDAAAALVGGWLWAIRAAFLSRRNRMEYTAGS